MCKNSEIKFYVYIYVKHSHSIIFVKNKILFCLYKNDKFQYWEQNFSQDIVFVIFTQIKIIIIFWQKFLNTYRTWICTSTNFFEFFYHLEICFLKTG